MTLIKINSPEYRLTDNNDKPVPGLEKTVFGPSSDDYFDDYLNQPEAVEFTREQGMIPLSILEAIAVREYSRDPKSWKTHKTRTYAVCGVRKGEAYVAFDDIPDARKNLVIAKAHKGYASAENPPNEEIDCHVKPLNIRGKTLREVLERAEKDQRVLPLPENGKIESHIAGKYNTNPYFLAIEGCLAQKNSELISIICRPGHIRLPTSAYILKNLKEGEARVYLLTLLENQNSSVCTSYFNLNFGLVRGVRNAPTFAEINAAWKERK